MLTNIEWWGGVLLLLLAATYKLMMMGIEKGRAGYSVGLAVIYIAYASTTAAFVLFFYDLTSMLMQWLYVAAFAISVVSTLTSYFVDVPTAENEEDEGESDSILGDILFYSPFIVILVLTGIKVMEVVTALLPSGQ